MKYERTLVAAQHERFADGCLDSSIGKEVRVTDYLDNVTIGKLLSYRVLHLGIVIKVVIEVEGDLLKPVKHIALPPSSGLAPRLVGFSPGKRYTGQRNAK